VPGTTILVRAKADDLIAEHLGDESLAQICRKASPNVARCKPIHFDPRRVATPVSSDEAAELGDEQLRRDERRQQMIFRHVQQFVEDKPVQKGDVKQTEMNEMTMRKEFKEPGPENLTTFEFKRILRNCR
jgi:hypothetical protein